MSQNKTHTRRNRYLLVCIILILLATLLPSDSQSGIKGLDKVIHFGMFFILSINICYKFKPSGKTLEILLWAIAFGFLTEFLQQYIPGRDMDFYDALTDTLGIILGYYAYQWFQKPVDWLFIKLKA